MKKTKWRLPIALLACLSLLTASVLPALAVDGEGPKDVLLFDGSGTWAANGAGVQDENYSRWGLTASGQMSVMAEGEERYLDIAADPLGYDAEFSFRYKADSLYSPEYLADVSGTQ